MTTNPIDWGINQCIVPIAKGGSRKRAVEAIYAKNPCPDSSGETKLRRKVTLPPRATMEIKEGGEKIVKVAYMGHTYSYNLSGKPFAHGHWSELFASTTTEGTPYALRVPKTDQMLHQQYNWDRPSIKEKMITHEELKKTVDYMKELHAEGPLPHVEIPGHLVTWKDIETGETRSAIWMVQRNRPNLHTFRYGDEFKALSAKGQLDIIRQLIESQYAFVQKRSTYFDGSWNNVNVDVDASGKVHLYRNDFDKVFTLPDPDSPKQIEDWKEFGLYLKQQGYQYAVTWVMVNELNAFLMKGEELKRELNPGWFDYIAKVATHYGPPSDEKTMLEAKRLLQEMHVWRERILAFQLGCLLKEMYEARQTHECHFLRYPHHTQAEYEERLNEVRKAMEEGFEERGIKGEGDPQKKLADMVMRLLDYNVENRMSVKEALELFNGLALQ